MNNEELVKKFSEIWEHGDGGALIDFVARNGSRMLSLMDAGALYLEQEPEDDES